MTVARFTDPTAAPRRLAGEIEEGYHVVTIPLRATRVLFSVAGRIRHHGTVAAGTVQISAPGDMVSAELSTPCDAMRLYVPHALLTTSSDAVSGGGGVGEIALVDPCFSRDVTIDRLRHGLLAAEAMGGAHGSLCAEGLGLAIVARLLDAHSNRGPAAQRAKPVSIAKWRLNRARDFIEANLEEPIRLADIANAAGLSRMHFASQFRVATGVRPHEYVTRRRIERAQELLATPERTIVDVALSVGFLTQAHFTTVFGRFVGETPLRWRQINMGPTHPPRLRMRPERPHWTGAAHRPLGHASSVHVNA